MGQNPSAQREGQSRRDDERLARLRAERSRRVQDCVDERGLVGSRSGSYRDPPQGAWGSRTGTRVRLRRQDESPTVGLEPGTRLQLLREDGGPAVRLEPSMRVRLRRQDGGPAVRLDERPPSMPTSIHNEFVAGDQAERAPTPFDTGDMMVDGPVPSVPVPSGSSGGLSGMLRRGRRLMSSHSTALGSDDAMLPADHRPGPRRDHQAPSNRHSMLAGAPNASRGGRNRLSTLLTTSTPTARFLRRRRHHPASISRPLPESDGFAWDAQSSLEQSGRMSITDDSSPLGPTAPGVPADFISRRSRLSRVRDSLLPPVPAFLQRLSGQAEPQDFDSGSPMPRGSRLDFADADHYLPRIPTPTIGLDITQSPLSSPEMEPTRQPGVDSQGLNAGPRLPRIERSSRRAPNPIQPDSFRHQRGEDQAARLSRHLSVAATAIAASLVGNTDRAFSDAHDVASDGVDGSFDSFLQALQNGSLATALRNGGNDGGTDSGTTSNDGPFAPVNFFRIFRFGSPNDPPGRSTGATPAADPDTEAPSRNFTGEPGGRMVPVIIVGIRSVTPRVTSLQDDGTTTSPLFDALSNLPLIMPSGLSSRGTGTLLRRTDRRSRFSRHRRASMSAVNSFPANYDSQRHHRLSGGAARQQMESRPLATSSPPTGLSETPPGPHPPPSTPAEHRLSAGSSGHNTPSRRPSSASGGLVLPSSNGATRPVGVPLEPSLEEIAEHRLAARRRRLSDGEFARYRDFGPGSSRRNGIVGDSEVDPAATSFGGGQPEGTRTWIVYVLGGSYPEDHPILTTPSLFTDSPTYEDMLLLSSILGPAKPPVASREEVASAPGVFRVEAGEHARVATSSTGDRIVIEAGERCLICLCDYELQEEVRQLNICRHLYHRECIDEWLTTGRNSCPLCRGQGVGKVSSQQDDMMEESGTDEVMVT